MRRRSQTNAPSATPAAPAPPADRVHWPIVGLVAATLLAYLPVFRAGFVWNDDDYVTAPALRSLAGLGRIWTDVGATEQYYPLLHSAFWLQHRLWGETASLYHLVSVLLHATSAVLFALVLRRLAVRGAWLAAGLFALHPVCVESVAWISEQKNTLSLVFFLGATLAYLRWQATPDRRGYGLATALFGCALLSKSLTAVLPAALLVIAWWRHGSLDWRRDARPLALWFALGIAISLFSAWVEHAVVGAGEAALGLTPLQRCLLAGRAVWFYAGKLLWPSGLSFFYPRWEIDVTDWRWSALAAAALALVAALGALRHRTRGPLAAALFFGGTLIPVAGFFDLYGFVYSFVADHWQYLPSLGLFALAGSGGAALGARLARFGTGWPPALAAAVLATLGAQTWRQTHQYHDLVTLFRTIQQTNPQSWMPHASLGQMLLDARRYQEALPLLERAVALSPASVQPRNNLAMTLENLGRPAEALRHFQVALARKPDSPELHYNIGNLQRRLGRSAEAIASFQLAVRLKPDFAFAHQNLAIALHETGRTTEARRHADRARRLDPTLPAVNF
ncbi:MAG: tetratricopeptide repeat protein [Verrucomicrobia bacterium]|nr:tetratricopeptide repeat protein [Verrucomicrobiota bacterium]